jgi:hypothetical protein
MTKTTEPMQIDQGTRLYVAEACIQAMCAFDHVTGGVSAIW